MYICIMKLNACCTLHHTTFKTEVKCSSKSRGKMKRILKNPFDDNSRYTMDALFLPFPGVHIKSNSKSIYV